MSVARAAIGVGRVRQSCQRTLEVEEKDAVSFRIKAGETGLHGPAPLMPEESKTGFPNAIDAR